MKFANRLEATRWMYNNVGNSVVNFGNLKVPDRVWVAGNGRLVGDVTAWERDDLTNIRTADHKEPEPEIDWDEVSSVKFSDAQAQQAVLDTLYLFSFHLMKLLEAKFEAKK